MKKILLICGLLLMAFALQAQVTKAPFPVKQTLGSKQTIVVSSGGLQADSAFMLPVYTDTVRANLGANAKYYPGDLIRTGDSIWIRNGSATKWLLVFSSSKAGVDTIWRTAGKDSIQYTINGRYHAIKDSLGGSISTYYLSNAGSGYRWAIPNTDSVKTLFVKTPLTIDSTTNARAITIGMDTTLWHSTAYHNTLYVPVGRSLIKGYGIANTLGNLTVDRTITFDSATVFPNLLATISLTQNAGGNSWNAVSRILNISPGTTFYNSNVGSGYRLVIPNTNNIKTLFGSGIITIDSTTNTNGITIIGTEVDGSTTNELQTLSNTSTSINHTVTLSNSGGSTRFEEGSGINLTTTGTSLNGVLTISALDSSATNEAQTLTGGGTTAPTINLSQAGGAGGGTVTFIGAGIVSLSQLSNTIQITGTEVDGSITNEIQHFINTSTSTDHTLYLSDSSGNGSIKYKEGGGIFLTTTGTALNGILKITAADSSATNEMQDLKGSWGSGYHQIDLLDAALNSYGNIQFQAGTGITFNSSGTAGSSTLEISADFTELDGDPENEIQEISASGGSSPTIDLSLSGGSVPFAATGIATVNESGGTITIGAVESDGDPENELQTLSASGTTSPSIDLSDGGGSVNFAASGIISLNQSGGTITIGATENDGDPTNEIQTFSSSGDSETGITWALASGGSLTLVPGYGVYFSVAGTSADPIVTIYIAAPEPKPSPGN